MKNDAENTNREIRRTASLAEFGHLAALNFQLFGMVTAYEATELKRNLSLAANLSARKKYLQRKSRVHGFPDRLVLFNFIYIELD